MPRQAEVRKHWTEKLFSINSKYAYKIKKTVLPERAYTFDKCRLLFGQTNKVQQIVHLYDLFCYCKDERIHLRLLSDLEQWQYLGASGCPGGWGLQIQLQRGHSPIGILARAFGTALKRTAGKVLFDGR